MSGVVSVGVAVGAAAFAATDIAAVGLTVGTALEVTAAVGAGVSAIGAVTHNKGLQIAGMGLGLVGGVGALASSAGLLGADAIGEVTAGAAAGSGAGGAFTGADAASMAGAAGLDVGGAAGAIGDVAASGPGTITDIIDSISGQGVTAPFETDQNPGQFNLGTPAANAASPDVTPPAAVEQGGGEGGTLGTTNNPAAESTDAQGTPAPVQQAQKATQFMPGNDGAAPSAAPVAPAPGGMINAPAPGTPALPGSGAVTGTTPSTPQSLINSGMPADAGVPGSNAAAQAAASASGSVPTTGPSNMFDKLLGFLSKDGGGRLAAGVVQAGAAFISGATSTLTPAQVKALNAQADANQAAANLSNRQFANAGQPIPVATRAPTAPPPPGGLINTRLPPPNAVTGAPT